MALPRTVSCCLRAPEDDGMTAFATADGCRGGAGYRLGIGRDKARHHSAGAPCRFHSVTLPSSVPAMREHAGCSKGRKVMVGGRVSTIVGCTVVTATLCCVGCGSGSDSCPSDLHQSFDTGSGGRCIALCSANSDCEGGQTCTFLTSTAGFCAEPTAAPTTGRAPELAIESLSPAKGRTAVVDSLSYRDSV